MAYLESKRYIHRDLACRNVLLAAKDKVNIFSPLDHHPQAWEFFPSTQIFLEYFETDNFI